MLVTKAIIRGVGIGISALGLAGLFFWFGYYRHAVTEPSNVSGDCSAPGNNNINCNSFNFGPQKRALDSPEAEPLRKTLKELPQDKDYTVTTLMGDAEAAEFAQQVRNFLFNTQHRVSRVALASFSPSKGVRISGTVISVGPSAN
jgi:hypothetical protein